MSNHDRFTTGEIWFNSSTISSLIKSLRLELQENLFRHRIPRCLMVTIIDQLTAWSCVGRQFWLYWLRNVHGTCSILFIIALLKHCQIDFDPNLFFEMWFAQNKLRLHQGTWKEMFFFGCCFKTRDTVTRIRGVGKIRRILCPCKIFGNFSRRLCLSNISSTKYTLKAFSGLLGVCSLSGDDRITNESLFILVIHHFKIVVCCLLL